MSPVLPAPQSPTPIRRSRKSVWIVVAVMAGTLLGAIALSKIPSSTPKLEVNAGPSMTATVDAVPTGRAVELTFDGTATGVDITMSIDGKMSQHTGLKVPMLHKDGSPGGFQYEGMEPGTRIYWSGQNTGDDGTLTCKIIVDGYVVEQNTSTGGFVITTCEATIPATDVTVS